VIRHYIFTSPKRK